MNKPVRVILLDEASEEFDKLNKIVDQQIQKGNGGTDEIQLLNSIKQKIELIRLNPFYGDNISKSKIPGAYQCQNLWPVELSQFWRMLYTIKGDQIEIICFILDIINHKKYNKKFGYKKK